MFFSINAFNTVDDCYRLNNNDELQKQEDYTNFNINNDKLFTDIKAAKHWINSNKTVMINGNTVPVNPEGYHVLGEEFFDFEAVCHRIHCPKHMFTYREFKDAIARGNDKHSNSLQVNFDGEIVLMPVINQSPCNLYDYAVRMETFQAGNKYVGHMNFDAFYEDLYHCLLDGWLDHLQLGRSYYYGEGIAEKTEEKLQEEIQKIYDKLLP